MRLTKKLTTSPTAKPFLVLGAVSAAVFAGVLLASPDAAQAQSEPIANLPVAPSPGGVGEQVAAALYNRGMVLFELGDIASAKKLFAESLERSPTGSRAADALSMLRKCNEKLGVPDLDAGRPTPGVGSDAPLDPYASGDLGGDSPVDPYAGAEGPVDPYAVDVPGGTGDDSGGVTPGHEPTDGSIGNARTEMIATGGLVGFMLGMAVVGPYEVVDGDTEELKGGAVPLGLAVGAGGAYLGHYLSKKYDRPGGLALSSGAFWGMYNFAHLGNVFVGENSNGNDIYKSIALGGLIGGGLGHFYARKLEPTEGEIAVVNTGSFLGTSAALMVGVAMDPPRGDAYSLNATIGSLAGIGAGIYLRDTIVASPGRMKIVSLGGLGGALLPWVLVYPFLDGEDGGDYQTAGFLSALSMGGGAYLAWRVTGNDDPEGAKAGTAKASHLPAPGLVQRSAEGGWTLGSPMPKPMQNHRLAPPRGFSMGADLLSGRF